MTSGETWNESVSTIDPATGRTGRRLTTDGFRNNTPTYHRHTAFTADSRYLVFVTIRDGQSALIRAELETGDLTVLYCTEGFGKPNHGMNPSPFARGPLGEGGLFCTSTSLHQESGCVLTAAPRSLLAVHIETGDTRALIEELDSGWEMSVPGGNRLGNKVYVPLHPLHPDLVAGKRRPKRSYKEALIQEYGGCPCRILEIDLGSGEQREVYSDSVAGTNHVLPCPSDEDVLLFDRDLPPTFAYYGDNCRSPRAHLYRISTGELTPLRPRNRHQFQSHTNWNHDGTRIYYHGPAYEGHEQPVYEGGRLGDMFVGVSDMTGESIFEMNIPEYNYGHVTTHPSEEIIVTDGLVTSEYVTGIHYEKLDRNGSPHIELLAKHDNDWNALLGQERDPHCHISPDGRWLSYNRAFKGRSMVHVVEIS